MDYGAIAAGAAGATSGVFGSIFNYNESKRNRHEARRQFDQQMNESIQRRVADGLKAGINPLAAIGASTNVSPTISTTGSSGTGDMISETGGRISKFLQSLFSRKARNDIEYDEQSKALDLEGQRLDNRIKAAKLTEIRHNTSPSGSKEEPAPSMLGEDLLFKPVYDIQGRPRLVVNQNALEADSDNPGYMSSIINAIGNAMHNNQITPDGRVVSPQLQMMLDDFYYQTTGQHIKNLESLYISPTEAAMATSMLVRGVH